MTTVYTYSLSTNFPNGLNSSQLTSIITSDTSITQTLLTIDTVGDAVYIIFNSALSSQTILDSLISSYVYSPIPNLIPTYIYPNNTLLRSNINSVETIYIGNQPNEIHISTSPQGQYSSIQSAITANPEQNMIFIVHPGTYVENNPIVLNTGCVLTSDGSAENTYIVAKNNTSDLITLGIQCRIESLTLMGASGSGSRGVYFNASQSGGKGQISALLECFIINCDIAMEIDGKNIQNLGGLADTLYMRENVINSTTQSLTKGVYVHSGGQFICMSTSIYGVPSVNTSPAYPISYAYYCTDPYTKISIGMCNCFYCGDGLYLDNSANSEIALLTCNYNNNGVHIGPTSTTSRLSVSSLESTYNANYDLYVEPTNAIVQVHSAQIDDTSIYNPNNVTLNMFFHSSVNNQNRQHLTGTICVGSVMQPTKMYIGQGYFDIYESTFLQNTTSSETGTFTDVSNYANNISTMNFNLFLGTAVDNCIYIGRTVNPCGIFVNIITATTSVVSPSALEWTYWNGTSWIPFTIMQTIDIAPYYFVASSFVSAVNLYQIRFGLTSQSPLVAKTINGISKKWVRLRIITALPNIPVVDSIFSHTNMSKYNTDGFEEFFGDARQIKIMSWDISNMYVCTTASSQNAYLGQKLGMKLSNNYFANGVESCIARSLFLPTDIDNSFPVKLKFEFIGDSAVVGNVQFICRYNYSNANSNVYTVQGSAPAVSVGEITTFTTITVSTANISYRGELDLNLSNIDMNPSNGGPQLLWISVERDASGANSNETYTGNITIIQLAPYYISWIKGCHILAY